MGAFGDCGSWGVDGRDAPGGGACMEIIDVL
jgi:hypothetical protein